MPPKKQAVHVAESQPDSNSAPAAETTEEKKSERAVAVRKPAAHPSTAVMVREALKALDSRKGVSSQAIQSYIKQKYPSVDLVRLKNFVRRALKKGIEDGTLVRPVHATITTGALGKFRLAPKVKEVKPKGENRDPNVQISPNAAKDGAKKTKPAGATKKKKSTNGEAKTKGNPKPAKSSTKDEAAAPSKVPPAKKPKAKKAEAKESDEGRSNSTRKTAKTKGETVEKKPTRKAAKAGSDAPASKAAGTRAKKTE